MSIPVQGEKLALLVRSLSGGGMEHMVLTLAAGFARRGYRVDLLVAVPTGDMAGQVPPAVRLCPLKPAPPILWRLWALATLPEEPARMVPLLLGPAPRQWRHLPGLIAYLRQEAPLALLSAGTQSNLAAVWGRELAGALTRVVVSERNTLSQVAGHARRRFRQAYPALVQSTYPRADGIVAISAGVAADLTTTAGIAPQRITIIHNPAVGPDLPLQALQAVDHPWFAAEGPPVILGVGRLHRQKDFATLLRAFARVRRERPVRLLILGEGEERGKLENLAAEIGITEDFSLPGFAANPFAYLGKAAVFVLSSAWEGFGNVVAEALACDCPVVSTDCPHGPAEILDHGACGRLVPVGDAAAMAAAILAALDDPGDSQRRLQRAKLFTEGPAVAKYLDLLLPGREEGKVIHLASRKVSG